MNHLQRPAAAPLPAGPPDARFGRQRAFLLASAALVVGCGMPLLALARFAVNDELYSYILLVPFISGYLVWLMRGRIPPAETSARRWAPLPLIAGAAGLAGYWLLPRAGTPAAPEDALALSTFSFVLLFGGVCCCFLGRETLKALAFPLGFLVFMVPFPAGMRSAMETFLQHGSAAVAFAFLRLSGMPVLQQGLVFHLPGFSMEVAPQCSGIHSSLALLLTSLLAGHFFLRTPWKRLSLVLAVVPLALLRNGFRVYTIGELCVHIGPRMIDSYIHRHGGPIFFILSLVPFFFLLFILAKSDRLPRPSTASNLQV